MALSVALPPVAGGCSVGGASRGSRIDDDVFGSLAMLLGTSHASPSLSSSSESSGIGSLGSLKSDSLPPSPHSDDKKLFDEPIALHKPKEVREVVPPVRVIYNGRDLLNLQWTLQDRRWQYRPAFLPSSNPQLFFENRSQYHRLGSHTQPHFVMEKCPTCGFESILSAVE